MEGALRRRKEGRKDGKKSMRREGKEGGKEEHRNNGIKLPVSGLVQHVKRLKMLTPYPYDQKKAKQAENQQLFLDSSEN